jgi:predicted TIM-barrel fold metal-dependent hydrolase
VVGEHGFKGVIINGHRRGRYLDNRFFWPVLARAEALKLRIYLHPTGPAIISPTIGSRPPNQASITG